MCKGLFVCFYLTKVNSSPALIYHKMLKLPWDHLIKLRVCIFNSISNSKLSSPLNLVGFPYYYSGKKAGKFSFVPLVCAQCW